MNQTIFIIRVFFFGICLLGSWLITLTSTDYDTGKVLFFGACLGALVILVDIYLKGFSLRGLSALTFGLAIGAVIAWIIASSPLFEPLKSDPDLAQNLILVQMILFVVLMYLGAVIALRGKDEFNLVIPYMKFVPHDVQTPLALVDTSALIDGRIVPLCRSGFFGHAVVIPKFVIAELQIIADSDDVQRKARGRRGIEALNQLRENQDIDLRVESSEVDSEDKVDAKLIFLARSLKAKILTTDFNLARLAQFEGVNWLNLNELAESLNPEVHIGLSLSIELLKPGKDPGQAVGYLKDGSMVVVNEGKQFIGDRVQAEVISVVPTSGGRMIFAKIN
ncbi:PIN/TRAM domain-containing protein [Puniceicoccus vermicola]|uniref:Twitching motility protein PilT n=1 Tax=Puniceicoccus vermicola TaxID=388746 RepID=A0A7X1E2T2_9BACT|nr:PIN domain-containing protein [Puniceicoccus vermicola]MBC2600351.1 twitching motility protein PilT [Puniceicoccus vermicola]